jgi:hypothetical protein
MQVQRSLLLRQVTREIRKSLCVEDICANTTNQLGQAFGADRCAMYLCHNEAEVTDQTMSPSSTPPMSPTTSDSAASNVQNPLWVDRLSEYVRPEDPSTEEDKPPLHFNPGYAHAESSLNSHRGTAPVLLTYSPDSSEFASDPSQQPSTSRR